MIPNYTHTLYCGHSYLMPSAFEGDAAATVLRLSLILGSQCVVSQVDEPFLFVDREKAFSLRLSIASSDFLCGDDSTELVFYLYRKGQSEPVAQASARMFEFDDFVLDFSFEAGTCVYGSYFLLGERVGEMNGEPVFSSVNGHLCYPFTLLPEGGPLPHPMPLCGELVRTGKETEETLYSSLPHELRLRLSQPVGLRSRLGVHCYTSGWQLMATAYRFFATSGRCTSKVTFRLNAGKIWFQDDYTVVLSHNMEPYAVIAFRYDGQKVTPLSCRPLSPEEDAYWIVKHLEQNPAGKWECIRELGGFSRDILRLVSFSRMNEFNRQCRRHGVRTLQAGTCLCVQSPRLFDARRLAFLLPSFLDLGTSSRLQIDCGDESYWETEKLRETFEERENKAFVFYHLEALLESGARPLLNRLEQMVPDRRVFSVFMLCGTEEEVEALLRVSPVLSSCFPAGTRLSFQPCSWQEVAGFVCKEAQESSLRLSPAAEHALVCQVRQLWETGRLSGWGREDAGAFLSASVIPAMQERLREAFVRTGKFAAQADVQPSDVRLEQYLAAGKPVETPVADMRRRFEESMKPLNGMVGLDGLKKDLEALFCQVYFDRQRRALNLSTANEGAYHMILTGNPGTGKTTAARLIGKVFHSLGLLSKGEVVVTERSQLLGRYIGETENNTAQVLRRARGNVLFIDEAYTLCDSLDDRKDFGNHVIESLLTVLAEPHPDMLVILAGYRHEMERLMQMNQGLKGRFPYKFHFDDYNAAELMQIARRFLSQCDYRLDKEAECLLAEVIERTLSCKDRYFSNARWIKQFFTSGVWPAMAARVLEKGTAGEADYCCIRREDIACAAAKFGRQESPVLVPRRRIGFTA